LSGTSNTNNAPLAFTEDDHRLVKSIRKLKESNIIKNELFKIISGTTLVGVISLLVPHIYTIVPVYETEQCEKYYGISFFDWVD
jgi:hypothetical protein